MTIFKVFQIAPPCFTHTYFLGVTDFRHLLSAHWVLCLLESCHRLPEAPRCPRAGETGRRQQGPRAVGRALCGGATRCLPSSAWPPPGLRRLLPDQQFGPLHVAWAQAGRGRGWSPSAWKEGAGSHGRFWRPLPEVLPCSPLLGLG